jgi:hypothetical protein
MPRETTDLDDRTERVCAEAQRLQWETELVLKQARFHVEHLRRLRLEVRALYRTRENERTRGLEALRRVYDVARIIPGDTED